VGVGDEGRRKGGENDGWELGMRRGGSRKSRMKGVRKEEGRGE
jgi:hypothetical protein